MSSDPLEISLLSAVEDHLRKTIADIDDERYLDLRGMMEYHLGWVGESADQKSGGKRVRPLLLLLSCVAADGKWETALPAATAVELIHNFSLIHDDIEDNSPIRRGRPSIWSKWGIPQAINTGDAMFTIAHLSVLDLARNVPPDIVLHSARLLQQTCLDLTMGQYLDIAYEETSVINFDDYWLMVAGKTAALLSACTEIGAVIAGSDPVIQEQYRIFGYKLGLAFQVQDDILGIWGDAALTGKSNDSDLLSGKKSLPILYALSNRKEFATLWQDGAITEDELEYVTAILESEGAKAYAQSEAVKLHHEAIEALDMAKPSATGGNFLRKLVGNLLDRQS
jgi:geranylgeranyl diphosphate synthase type I